MVSAVKNKKPFFRNNENLKTENVTELISREEFEKRVIEISRSREDILYFAEKYFTIVSPGKGKHIIELFPKQKQLLKFFQDNDRCVVLSSRQTAKTTSTTIFALHICLFQQHKKILIAANKLDVVIEILDRIRLAYENLPNWIKCGVTTWNRKKIEFSNGCSIEGIATTSDSGRSKSANILLIDEGAFLDNGGWEFWQAVYPVVSSAKGTKVIMSSTPNGPTGLFYETYEAARLDNHKDGWKAFVMNWWDMPGRDDVWKRQTIASLNNDMIKFNREYGNCFGGSTYTLFKIDHINKFKDFVGSEKWFAPKEIDFDNVQYKYKEWFKPEKNHTYLVSGDVCDGAGIDKSIALVFDITNGLNPRQIASFASSTISTIEFTYVLVKLASFYNNAYLAFENNSIGKSIIDSLISVYSYDNIISYGTSRGLGIHSHAQSKATACGWARDIVGMIDVTIYDKDLVQELEYFEKVLNKHNTYCAKPGKHDDYVMSFIWFLLCLKEEVIDNYYNVESYYTTNMGINLPCRIQNTSLPEVQRRDETIQYEQNINNFDSKYDNIFKSLNTGTVNTCDNTQSLNAIGVFDDGVSNTMEQDFNWLACSN